MELILFTLGAWCVLVWLEVFFLALGASFLPFAWIAKKWRYYVDLGRRS